MSIVILHGMGFLGFSKPSLKEHPQMTPVTVIAPARLQCAGAYPQIGTRPRV